MQTDVSLTSSHRKIIIECKYSPEAVKMHYDLDFDDEQVRAAPPDEDIEPGALPGGTGRLANFDDVRADADAERCLEREFCRRDAALLEPGRMIRPLTLLHSWHTS
jgi:hypothetical protein